jgi:hypothetical protein
MNIIFYLSFHDAFVVHLSPHQFGVAIMGGYEAMLHHIWTTLDVHFNWVGLHIANIFVKRNNHKRLY